MTEKRIGVLGLGAYVPDRVMTNDDWAEHVDTTDEWITARTGIKTRRMAAEDQTTVDLAAAAAESALADAGVGIGEIDEVPAFDLAGSGCAGFILGLDVARSRAQTGNRKILLVGVELLTRLMDWKDRATCVLFGDAAGAAVVGAGEGAAEILGFTAGTDGTQAELLGLEMGGTRAPFTLEGAQRRDHKKVIMKGREVFREAVTRMGAAAKEVLAQAGVVVDDVKLVIPHQANLRIINAVQKALAVPDDKIHVNVQDYGNTGSASVPLALWEARNQGRVEPGDLVLLTAFGAGFHWAAALLRF